MRAFRVSVARNRYRLRCSRLRLLPSEADAGIVSNSSAGTLGVMMDQGPLREFGTTAKSLSRNPLGIIALFIVLVYGLACIVIIGSSMTPPERMPIIYFLIIFPFVVLGVFTYLVSFRAGQLFAPADFKNEETYLELQKMGSPQWPPSPSQSRRRA
jgi:hypothetical protein